MLNGADHKAVVLQLTFPAIVQGKWHPRFSEGMLANEMAMLQVEAQVAAIDAVEPAEWGEVVVELITDAGKRCATAKSIPS